MHPNGTPINFAHASSVLRSLRASKAQLCARMPTVRSPHSTPARLSATVPAMIALMPETLAMLTLSPKKSIPIAASAAITTALQTAYATEISSARKLTLNV